MTVVYVMEIEMMNEQHLVILREYIEKAGCRLKASRPKGEVDE